MRVDEVTGNVYSGLRALGKRRYLCAMWMVCAELQVLYKSRLSADESALMLSTLGLVRDVVLRGEASGDAVVDAASLYGQWNLIRSGPRSGVMSGHSNARMVFRDLAGEIAGLAQSYDATEWVDLAATDRWREHLNGPLWDDPDEEVSDASPMAQTLTFLERTVSAVTVAPESFLRDKNWDPQSVQDELIGKPPTFPGEG